MSQLEYPANGIVSNPVIGPRLHPNQLYRTMAVMPRWQQYCALEYSNEAHARACAKADSIKDGETVEVFFDNCLIARYSNGVDTLA